MSVHKEHGQTLGATLSSRGATIIEQAGVIWNAAYHGTELPLDGYAMKEAEIAAMDVLAAIDKYRDATKPEAADPVITWPRPSYHRQAEGHDPGCMCFQCRPDLVFVNRPVSPGLRAEHVMPDERYRYSGDVRGDGPEEAA